MTPQPPQSLSNPCCERLISDLVDALMQRSFIDSDGDYYAPGLSHDEIWDIVGKHRTRSRPAPSSAPLLDAIIKAEREKNHNVIIFPHRIALNAHNATTRKDEREKVLDELLQRVCNEEQFFTMGSNNEEIYYMTGQHIRKIVESLRREVPE